MHDPSTVAFEIKSPFRSAPSQFWPKGYRNTLVTIWHEDPESDGTDDSCGWFKRARHGDPKVLEQIRKDFDFDWDPDYGGWFNKDGSPALSVSAVTLNMFRRAAGVHFGADWRATDRFMRRRLYDILWFAENPTDSMRTAIVQKYGREPREDRVASAASVIYGCILRWEQPWYRHARWHVWHWRLQIHPWQTFRRWALSRCAGCGSGFAWGYSPTSFGWGGKRPKFLCGEVGIYHSECADKVMRDHRPA